MDIVNEIQTQNQVTRPDRGAWLLYEATKPVGGLSWHELTIGQRARYRYAWMIAIRLSDVTAIRAGMEAAAQSIASHHGILLAETSPAQRRAWRYMAMDAVRAYERQLSDGTPEMDADWLKQIDKDKHSVMAADVDAVAEVQ